jgi:hypothetical protein
MTHATTELTRTSPTRGYRMTHVLRTALLGFTLATCLGVVSCSDPITSPDERDPSEVKLLHVTYDYPPLAETTVSFWAVKGRATGADLWYHARPGATDSTRLVEFRMGANALDRRPDGTTIAPGDSVLITLTANDPAHMMVQFQPSGLRFSATDKPSLKIYWTACGDDLNYDGRVDSSDDAIVSQLSIWRQETPGAKWQRISSVTIKPNREIDALLSGFTGYAIML